MPKAYDFFLNILLRRQLPERDKHKRTTFNYPYNNIYVIINSNVAAFKESSTIDSFR